MRISRPVSWLKAVRKEFETFSSDVQERMFRAITIAAEGRKDDLAKPFKGVNGGVFEIAIKNRGNAYRAIYAVQIGAELWVVDAFQKKSMSGVKTP
jgi:phage-related protein